MPDKIDLLIAGKSKNTNGDLKAYLKNGTHPVFDDPGVQKLARLNSQARKFKDRVSISATKADGAPLVTNRHQPDAKELLAARLQLLQTISPKTGQRAIVDRLLSYEPGEKIRGMVVSPARSLVVTFADGTRLEAEIGPGIVEVERLPVAEKKKHPIWAASHFIFELSMGVMHAAYRFLVGTWMAIWA